MYKHIEQYGPVETFGQLKKLVKDIEDIDSETPIEIFCHDRLVIDLLHDEKTNKKLISLDGV